MHLLEPRLNVLALGKVERRDDLAVLLPLIDAELLTDRIAADDEELFLELLAQLALPLEGEIRRTDNEHALRQPAQLQLAQQEARHDRLPRAGVVCEQESNARQLEQVVVHRLELVRQRVDARNREREVRVELVRDAERVGLQAQLDERAVAVE